MALKSIQRSATVAFAPMAQVMAVGTMAGAIDPSFSSSANLELLKLDFANTDLDMPVLSSAVVPERFNRLSWSNVGAGAVEEFPLGVIAGGLADGSLHFWNPHKLLSEDPADHEIAAVYKNPDAHKGNVYGLEFSPLTPNILASGGEDGALIVWDLTTPSAASTFPPLKGAVQGEPPVISYVSWNRKVQHIVASTSYSGTSVVWDLRRAKPVISFTDPTSRRRCSTLQWNPEVATQLIVASDDDRSPSLQVWDLRNSVSPIKELVGHTKGVLAMAWCPCDSSFLLTCSKDNQTLCWDTASGEILCEVPSSNNWNFDVQWSPCTPGVLSTSSYDGKIGIYNIEACSRTSPAHDNYFGGAVGGRDYSAALRKAPKWVGRRNPVTFGFGGTLVSIVPKKPTPGSTTAPSDIRIQHLLTEEGLVKRSTEFEEAIAGGERSALRNFCETKASVATSEEDAETWSFLKIMFDEEARKQLLAHFGFSAADLDKPEEQEEENPLSEELANLGLTENSTSVEEPKPAPVIHVDDTLEGPDDGEDFFDRLETPPTPTEPSAPIPDDVEDSTEVESAPVPTEPVSEEAKDDGDNETDEAIQRTLVAGDFKRAVEYCLAAGRVADALVMAAVGGTALWEKTQQEYFRRTKRPYLKVVSAVVNNDLQGLVESRPLKVWKETLALICTYARSEDWTNLCDALGARLDAGRNIQAATLCYICAGNIERTVDIWSRTLKSKKGGPEFVDVLQDIMEKSVILGLATGTKQVSTSLARLVCYYAELLASQGLLSTALEYIKLIPSDDSSSELSALRERISQSGQVASIKSNIPSYPEKSYQTEQQLPATAPLSNQQYSSAVQQPSYYPPDSYQHESTSSPSYASNLPPVQPMETLFPNQPIPPIRYNQPQSNYTTPSPPAPVFVPTPPQPISSFTPTLPPNTFQPPYPPSYAAPPPTQSYPAPPPQSYAAPPPQSYAAPPPSSFQGPPMQPYTSMNAPKQGFMVPSATSAYPSTNPHQPMQTAIPGPPSMQQPGVMMPSPALPSMPPVPAAPGFMPVSAASQQQAEPQSPHAAGNTSAPSFAPPPTVQTADTSNVAAELKPVVMTLTRLFDETSAFLGGAKAPPAKKREIEDNSRKLGALFVKLNSADLSANASTKLGQLCQAINAGDYNTASQIQVALTTSDWDECGFWLTALKRMIKLRQAMR